MSLTFKAALAPFQKSIGLKIPLGPVETRTIHTIVCYKYSTQAYIHIQLVQKRTSLFCRAQSNMSIGPVV
jgi:hypothetical protein